MKVYLVSELVGKFGIPSVIGVFSTLALAKEAVERICEEENRCEDDFDIEKWFVDTTTLRGE